MKRALFVVGLVAVAAAYTLGFWPERSRALAAEAEVARVSGALASAQDEARLGRVLGDALRLSDAIVVENYGEAAGLSSRFFHHVRDELGRTGRADMRAALTAILQARDEVTSAVARADGSVQMLVRGHELMLRRALGYAVP